MHTIWGKRQRGIGQRGPGHEDLAGRARDRRKPHLSGGSKQRYSGEYQKLQIMDREDLPKDMILVSDGFHQYRAGLIAQKQGIEAGAVSAQTPWYTLATYWMREIFALAQEILFH